MKENGTIWKTNGSFDLKRERLNEKPSRLPIKYLLCLITSKFNISLVIGK